HAGNTLTPPAIQEFIRGVWERKGNKTANQYIKIANRWLRFKGLEEMKYFKEYGSEFTIQYCSPEEKALLLQTAARKGPREKAMFYLLFGTGVRLAEACDLKIQDIRPETVRVTGKGQKVREIYLPPETRRAIDDYLLVRKQPTDREDLPYLFTTGAGRKMSYS
ncbi:MAG: tyrosine-type recombinase/integrase, partial [Candidatus Thermoplasmatota archaeon]|nr:tyrosine-type recombinase/integrase [Candidatus Thermoplasmatota archaeon]